MSQLLKLSSIVINANTQSREAINDDVVAEYAERMREGDKFPPVVVFHDGSKYFLADGFHRVLAAERNDFRDILADVRKGTRADALKYSLGANITHGLKRTNADKRHAIGIALREFPELSDRAIAEMCGVSNQSVANHRPQVSKIDTSTPPKRVGLDGKQYPSAKPAPAPAQPEPTPAPAPEPEPEDEEDGDEILPGETKESSELIRKGLEKLNSNPQAHPCAEPEPEEIDFFELREHVRCLKRKFPQEIENIRTELLSLAKNL
jgi:ParB-like chromosome segregation protein Spo0J